MTLRELVDFADLEFVITVRHGHASELGRVRRGRESRPQLLSRGPLSIVHAVVDRVVDDYAPVVAGASATRWQSR